MSLQGIFNIVLHTFAVERRAAFWILWITMGIRSSLISFFKFSSNVLGMAPRAPTVTITVVYLHSLYNCCNLVIRCIYFCLFFFACFLKICVKWHSYLNDFTDTSTTLQTFVSVFHVAMSGLFFSTLGVMLIDIFHHISSLSIFVTSGGSLIRLSFLIASW